MVDSEINLPRFLVDIFSDGGVSKFRVPLELSTVRDGLTFDVNFIRDTRI